MTDKTRDLLERFHDEFSNREMNPELDQALTRWDGYSHVIEANGKWRLGGIVTYLQSQLEILRAVDPSLPVSLPPHCLDPNQLARFLGIPLENFDWPGDEPLTRIESKVDMLLKSRRDTFKNNLTAPSGAAPKSTPPKIEWQRRGTDWHFRFQHGDILEDEPFADLLGFRCWEVLFQNPKVAFGNMPQDFEKMCQLPPPRNPRKLFLASAGRIDADADSRKAVLDAEDDDSVARLELSEPDRIGDKRTIKDLDKDIERSQKELAVTVNPERRTEIEQEIHTNKEWRGKLVNRKGELRPLTAPDNEAARKRVRNLLDRARAEIGKKMPAFARYLAIAEKALEYDPSKAF